MVTIQNITKKFLKTSTFLNLICHYLGLKRTQKITALHNVSLHIQSGQSVGLLGNNGAGKTTLIKIICGLIIPDEGAVTIDGQPVCWPATRKFLGYVGPGARSFFWRISGRENLYFFGSLYGLRRKEIDGSIERISRLLNMKEFLDLDFNKYSSGMRQKLNLARALLHNPRVLLLDEPALNLDMGSRKKLIQFITKIKDEYKLTLIWVSHTMEELLQTCEEIVILHGGRLICRRKREEVLPACSADPLFWYDEMVASHAVAQEEDAGVSDHKRSGGLFPERKPPGAFGIGYVWNIMGAFLRKDFKTWLSYKFSFIFSLLGIFFPIITFFFMSRLFGETIHPFVAQYADNYFSFVLTGIALISYITTSLTAFSSKLRLAQVLGVIEHILIAPINLFLFLTSSVVLPFIITSFRFLVFLVLGIMMGSAVVLSPESLIAAGVIFTLTIIISISLGVLSAAFIMIFKQGDPLSGLLSHTLKLFSGTYFPVKLLPHQLYVISGFIPFTHALQSLRLTLLKGYSLVQVVHSVGILSAFAAVLLPASVFVFSKATERAKREGTLCTY